MGYTLRIGNAVPISDKSEFPILRAGWEVEPAELGEAPSFPGDHDTGKSNHRSPAYGVWQGFCEAVGLYSMFCDRKGNLHMGQPGCVGITRADADRVTAALERYRATAALPPGFEQDRHYNGPRRYDGNLARLIWLEWWMRWAVERCETPAIECT